MKKIILIFFLLFLMTLSGCSFPHDSTNYAKEAIQRYIEVVIPEECEMVYYYSDTHFGPGRPAMYVAFKFEDEPVEFLEEFNFIEDKNSKFEEEVNNKIEQFSTSYNVSIPQEYLINFYRNYSYLDSSTGVYLIWFSFNKILIGYVMPT